MTSEHKYNYRWTLGDAVFTKDKGKVFSCFACGGGSTMGYNFAGQSSHYVCGMSVPPIMMAQIANQIYEQWLSKIRK